MKCIDYKKLFLFLTLLTASSVGLVAQEIDDFDAMFADAQDITVDEQNDIHSSANPAPAADSSLFKIPIQLSGNFSADVAGIGIFNESKNKPASAKAGFVLRNDLNFYVYTPNKDFSLHGTVRIEAPAFSLTLKEFYFDYVLLDRIYLTAGKKPLSWGYVRLFDKSDTRTDLFATSELVDNLITGKKVEPTFYSNVLHDSSDNFSAIIRIPIKSMMITAVGMYTPNVSSNPFQSLSYALSLEMLIRKTSLNIFGRTYPFTSSMSNANDVAGLELKRTFFGADFYLQNQIFFQRASPFFHSYVGTLGAYDWWDLPTGERLGGNIEYQYIYDYTSNSHSHWTALSAGATRLGKHNNIKIGIDWLHDWNTHTGDAKVGVIWANIFRYVDWKNGLEFEYGSNVNNYCKITYGTTFAFRLNY